MGRRWQPTTLGTTYDDTKQGWFLGRAQATRRFWAAARAAGLPWLERVHGYVYARWPYAYIGAGIGERPGQRRLRLLFAPFLALALFPKRWAASYHGKVMPADQATRLVQIREPIHTRLSEQVIPFETARDLALSDPDHIVALDCPCRALRVSPCLPLDVCLIVGEPFASMVLAHHPERARAITADEATAIIAAEAERGHVHHAFFKEAMLGRFYAICNCCACCCGAMSAHRHGTPMLISSGYVAQVTADDCVSCGQCVSACPFDALSLNGTLRIDSQACMGCGVCVRVCPSNALALVRDSAKPAPLVLSDLALPQMMVSAVPGYPNQNGGAQ